MHINNNAAWRKPKAKQLEPRVHERRKRNLGVARVVGLAECLHSRQTHEFEHRYVHSRAEAKLIISIDTIMIITIIIIISSSSSSSSSSCCRNSSNTIS